MDNFGDEATLPKLKLSIRKTAQEDFIELYDEVFSNDSPLSDHWKQNVYLDKLVAPLTTRIREYRLHKAQMWYWNKSNTFFLQKTLDYYLSSPPLDFSIFQRPWGSFGWRCRGQQPYFLFPKTHPHFSCPIFSLFQTLLRTNPNYIDSIELHTDYSFNFKALTT